MGQSRLFHLVCSNVRVVVDSTHIDTRCVAVNNNLTRSVELS
jgi:hypothetical protein